MTVTTTNRPVVSFGLPVRNGASTIGQAIESVLTQTFEDWELVISDNLSTDGTSEICATYAAADSRIRHVPTGRDISQNGNFIEVFRLARGEFFRWHGDDDWLEPRYAERTVAALEATPGAVICTTLQRYYEGDKAYPLNDRLNEIPGVTAADPVERLAQFLRVYRASGWFGIDPIYSLVRRDALEKTEVMPALRFGDFVTSCEISLQGTFTHVPEVLAHRRLAAPKPNIHPLEEYTNRRTWTQYVQREISLLEVWRSAAETGSSRRRLVLPFARFWMGTQFWDRVRRHVGPRSAQPT